MSFEDELGLTVSAEAGCTGMTYQQFADTVRRSTMSPAARSGAFSLVESGLRERLATAVERDEPLPLMSDLEDEDRQAFSSAALISEVAVVLGDAGLEHDVILHNSFSPDLGERRLHLNIKRRVAKEICAQCVFLDKCRTWALADPGNAEFQVVAGMTYQERLAANGQE